MLKIDIKPYKLDIKPFKGDETVFVSTVANIFDFWWRLIGLFLFYYKTTLIVLLKIST